MDFDTHLAGYLDKWQTLIDRYYADQLPNLTPPELQQEPGGKFIRIVTASRVGSSVSASAFVAKADGANKTLGQWKAGDIFKPASFKAPAKHARGNIFDAHNGMEYMTEHGPAYLR